MVQMDRYMDMSSWWRRIDMRRVFHHRWISCSSRGWQTLSLFRKLELLLSFFSLKSFVFFIGAFTGAPDVLSQMG